MNKAYIKNKPHCIEEKALKMFGITECFELAGYILEDGRMLNFSYSGYMREEDHRIIGQFFKKAQGYNAVCKFMKRGNIRIICSNTHYGFEFIKKPTKAQIRRIAEAYKQTIHDPNIHFYIDKADNHGKIIWTSYDPYVLYDDYNQ
jgi:hypothetical protein